MSLNSIIMDAKQAPGVAVIDSELSSRNKPVSASRGAHLPIGKKKKNSDAKWDRPFPGFRTRGSCEVTWQRKNALEHVLNQGALSVSLDETYLFARLLK